MGFARVEERKSRTVVAVVRLVASIFDNDD